jgi:uncharacterized protein
MARIVIVPGLGGSGETHWQTHLQRSLPNTTRVQQDDWEKPELAPWVQRLVDVMEEINGPAVLVAHSLGCPLVAHLALRRPDLSIKGALLVAPADVDSARHTPKQTHDFAPIPRCRLPFRSIVVASTNDPYITMKRASELATAWGADFVNAGPVGHINVDSGFGPWTEGQRMVKSLIAGAGSARSQNRRRFAGGAR